MTEKTLPDWRLDGDVIDAAAAHSRASLEVSRLEDQYKAAQCEQRRLQAEVDRMMHDVQHGKAVGLSVINAAKLALGTAKEAAGKLEQQSEGAYRTFAATETALSEASDRAKRATWPAHLEAYKAAVKDLDRALSAAVDCEERVSDLHAMMMQRFGSVDRWVLPPDGSLRIGGGAYAHRKLQRASYESWQQWVQQNVLDAGGRVRERARAAVEGLRAMAGA